MLASFKGIFRNSTPAVLLAGILYYQFSYKPSKLKHDTEVAKEFCSQELKTFAICTEEHPLSSCEKSMLILNDCVYRKKAVNREDKDRF